MLKSHDKSRALRTKKHKGGSGEKTALLDEKEETREKETILCVIYLDHILFKNINSDELKPSLRISIGWLIKETTEYIVIWWDQSLTENRDEAIQVESGLLILKNTILAIMPVDSQPLRSWKTIEDCLRGQRNDGKPLGHRNNSD